MYVLQSPILCVKALFHVCASMTTITNKPCAEELNSHCFIISLLKVFN